MCGSDIVQRWLITVHGIVQGVGFRPFVHRLALQLGLSGIVRNFTGGVEIEVEGPSERLGEFVERLRSEHPPIAVIESLQHRQIEPQGQSEFVIVRSEQGEGPIFVSPDVAICEDCRRELADPSDKRYRHPFINCTNCGPRFTIIKHLPYDRPNTSMAKFPMCPECRREYEDITNRRYHAQPVCCPDCGPQVWLAGRDGKEIARGYEAIVAARRLLHEGGIVAVKGLGGFHLACDAINAGAVCTLRQRKRRWEKPFAVMAPSIEAAEEFALIDERAREIMTGPRAPIVLVAKRLPERLAEQVAPDSTDYGVMLPYTPLHILLMGDSDGEAEFLALVMTSGNLSDEPLCTDNEEALRRLGELADAFLLHDRDILIGCDDSVVRASAAGLIMMRRSRGYAPMPVRLPIQTRPILGVGGHLKNTFCLASGDLAYPSQHIGDLDNAETLDYMRRSLERLEELCQIEPEVVACDLHPDYLSTRFAEELAEEKGLELIRVQHHHAHMAACLADNRQRGPVIGLICDGTGYGGDGTVWGCEVLVGDLAEFQRIGHLRYCGLPGGEKAIEQPWRVAVAWLADTFGLEQQGWPRACGELVRAVGQGRVEAILQMLRRGVNCPYASSAGRLFDAVAAILGLKLEGAYEAQPAMMLECAARETIEGCGDIQPYPFELAKEPAERNQWGECLVIDPRPTFRAIVEQLGDGAGKEIKQIVAARFHVTFVEMLARAARWACERTGIEQVALSGGTFQNRFVLERLVRRLEAEGLKPLWHRQLSPNDSAIAVGQVAVAAARLGMNEGARRIALEKRGG